MSLSEAIRQELIKDFGQSAASIIRNLKSKGTQATAQHIYQIRSSMRNNPEQRAKALATAVIGAGLSTGSMATQSPLKDFILQVLKNHATLSESDIAGIIKKMGYISNASNFLLSVRRQLNRMLVANELQRSKDGFSLIASETKFSVPACPAIMVGTGQNRAELKLSEGLNPGVVLTQDANNLELLTAAIIDYAKATGIPNPEQFPERLIKLRQDYEKSKANFVDQELAYYNGLKQD